MNPFLKWGADTRLDISVQDKYLQWEKFRVEQREEGGGWDPFKPKTAGFIYFEKWKSKILTQTWFFATAPKKFWPTMQSLLYKNARNYFSP